LPSYEAEAWEPPAPIVRATVRGPRGTAALNVPMLIDSGSDVSVVPEVVVQAVGASISPARTPIEFYSGAGESWDEARLSVEFARYRFEGLFLVAEASYGILGRNILNLLTLTLDGPALSWSMGEPRARPAT